MATYPNKADVLTILIKAREKITPPERWTKKVFKRRRRHEGRTITCYCLDGAIQAVKGATSSGYVRAEGALRLTIDKQSKRIHGHPHNGIIQFNDCPHTTHEEVLAMLDATIETLKEA